MSGRVFLVMLVPAMDEQQWWAHLTAEPGE
jgi:hypothetical protein